MASPEMAQDESGQEAAVESKSPAVEYVDHYLPGASEKLKTAAENAAEMPDGEIDELIAFLERVKAERAAGSPEGGSESVTESVEDLKAQIRDYEGDRQGLADLVRKLGEANTDNPGYIDRTSAGSILAEKTASAIENGFGMNVSMAEAQEAAVRVYEREAGAANLQEAGDETAPTGSEIESGGSVESVEAIKAQIEEYNGDLEGLADLVRKLGEVNGDNPGFIDGTASGSISAERAASAIRRGFGHNVSFAPAQEAAHRIMVRDGQLDI